MERDELLEIIELAKEQKVKKLSLANRGITELPSEIYRLMHLQKLDLSYNSISKLPDEFCRLTNLRSIYLNHNELECLPEKIGNLKNLQILDLSSNLLETLPSGIGNLVELSQLDLGYNRIKKLPLEFVNLTSLKKLFLENNPCEFPPEKVIKRGLYATMHYLFGEIRKKEAAKVIMQVYNMPRDIITPFTQYINCFNDLISTANDTSIDFEIKYIKQDFTAEMEFNLEAESYLNEFLEFLKSNIISKGFHKNGIKGTPVPKDQIQELRSQIQLLNNSLTDKMDEIRQLQKQLSLLTDIIGNTENKSE
jgi:Leucine-rich repeat (LRR) protein